MAMLGCRVIAACICCYSASESRFSSDGIAVQDPSPRRHIPGVGVHHLRPDAPVVGDVLLEPGAGHAGGRRAVIKDPAGRRVDDAGGCCVGNTDAEASLPWFGQSQGASGACLRRPTPAGASGPVPLVARRRRWPRRAGLDRCAGHAPSEVSRRTAVSPPEELGLGGLGRPPLG
jgi:hypothetical protein